MALALVASALLALVMVALASVPARAIHGSFAKGDVFVSSYYRQQLYQVVAPGHWYHPNGVLNKPLRTGSDDNNISAGLAFDVAGNLYMTRTSGRKVSKFDRTGTHVGDFGTGYEGEPTSIVFDRQGSAYVGQLPFGTDTPTPLLKFNPSGALEAQFYLDGVTEPGIKLAIDLAADQCSLYYNLGEGVIKRFDVCQNSQLADFSTGLEPLDKSSSSDALVIPDVSVLPTGEVLATDGDHVHLLSASGNIIRTYDAATNKGNAQDNWGSLALDPDTTSFWASAADVPGGGIYKFDISSGRLLLRFDSMVQSTPGGLAIFEEPTAARTDPTTTTPTTTTTTTTTATTTTTLPPGTTTTAPPPAKKEPDSNGTDGGGATSQKTPPPVPPGGGGTPGPAPASAVSPVPAPGTASAPGSAGATATGTASAPSPAASAGIALVPGPATVANPIQAGAQVGAEEAKPATDYAMVRHQGDEASTTSLAGVGGAVTVAFWCFMVSKGRARRRLGWAVSQAGRACGPNRWSR